MIIYLYDILVYTLGTPEEYIQGLEQVSQCLKEANLKLKPEKCIFFTPSLLYIGHIMDKNKKTDPAKVQVMQAMKPPTTLPAVREVAGLCGGYR